MKSVQFENRITDVCPECDSKKRGVVFYPVADVPGCFIIVQILNKQFLCEEYFQKFVITNNLLVRYDERSTSK